MFEWSRAWSTYRPPCRWRGSLAQPPRHSDHHLQHCMKERVHGNSTMRGRLVMLGRLTALASVAICILLMSEGAGAAGPELPTLQPGVLRIGTYFVNPPFDLIVNTVRTPKIRSLSDLRDAVVGVQAVTTDDDVALRMQKAG